MFRYTVWVLIIFLFVGLSCKKNDENPVAPSPGPVSSGSGSIIALYNGTDTLAFSGEGSWPPSGTGVAAAMDSSRTHLQIIGYSESTAKVSPRHPVRWLSLTLADTANLTTRNYQEAVLSVGIDIDTAEAEAFAYNDVKAILYIDSLTPTRIAGRFSGEPVRSDGQHISVHDGEFHVNYVLGIPTTTIVRKTLTIDPDSVVVSLGSQAFAYVSGGTPPYYIKIEPIPLIASAGLTDSILTLTGEALGWTDLVVADHSSPEQQIYLQVIVSSFGGSGTCSFSSDRGDFFAQGTYSPTQTRGTMVGAARTVDSVSDNLQIYGFRFHSATDADYFSLTILAPRYGDLTIGEYSTPIGFNFIYALHINPHPQGPDTSFYGSAYHLTSGVIELLSLTAATATGTFSGTGQSYSDLSQTIVVNNGSFNVNYVRIVNPMKNAQNNIRKYIK